MRKPKIWRAMTEEERELAIELRDFCYTGDGLPFLQWRFVKEMALRATEGGEITDKQGNLIRRMAQWFGLREIAPKFSRSSVELRA
jgi:hypothetical protein